MISAPAGTDQAFSTDLPALHQWRKLTRAADIVRKTNENGSLSRRI
jgi:hypothetical protein